MVSQDRGAIGFAERLLNLLDQGSFVATYKYALLLALNDLCLEHSTRMGSAPTSLTTPQLAEKIIELYWPQTAPFQGPEAADRLVQATHRQAKVISDIVRFKVEDVGDSSALLQTARSQHSSAFDRLRRKVEWKLIQDPLPRLQHVGGHEDRFIYEISWDQTIKRGQFTENSFDNRILFIGNAGDHLVRLSGLLRPLVQQQWAAMVTRLNRELVDDRGLGEFLFGMSRIALGRVRTPLRELQNDRCFYCERHLVGSVEVDHFIPWARYPDNSIQNLVVADSRCNNSKRQFLAASDHVARWRERLRPESRLGSDLTQAAHDLAWEAHPKKTLNVARAIYLRLPDNFKLWYSQGEFSDAKRDDLTASLR